MSSFVVLLSAAQPPLWQPPIPFTNTQEVPPVPVAVAVLMVVAALAALVTGVIGSAAKGPPCRIQVGSQRWNQEACLNRRLSAGVMTLKIDLLNKQACSDPEAQRGRGKGGGGGGGDRRLSVARLASRHGTKSAHASSKFRFSIIQSLEQGLNSSPQS